jgi:redox-sensitive bicupin YhaK (pirin superfamily)
VQIIRSGNGISHAEKLLPASAIFQIWFDPDLSKTLSKPASYNDYASADFPVSEQNGITTRVFKGALSPMEMDTEGVLIKELVAKEGHHSLVLDSNKVYSLFLISGSLLLNEGALETGDFAKVQDAGQLELNVNATAKIFLIESPVKPSYETYIEANG